MIKRKNLKVGDILYANYDSLYPLENLLAIIGDVLDRGDIEGFPNLSKKDIFELFQSEYDEIGGNVNFVVTKITRRNVFASHNNHLYVIDFNGSLTKKAYGNYYYSIGNDRYEIVMANGLFFHKNEISKLFKERILRGMEDIVKMSIEVEERRNECFKMLCKFKLDAENYIDEFLEKS